MRLEFHPEADLELAEAAIHYEERVPGLGERLAAEVEHTARLLMRNPEIGSPVDPELRRFESPGQ